MKTFKIWINESLNIKKTNEDNDDIIIEFIAFDKSKKIQEITDLKKVNSILKKYETSILKDINKKGIAPERIVDKDLYTGNTFEEYILSIAVDTPTDEYMVSDYKFSLEEIAKNYSKKYLNYFIELGYKIVYKIYFDEKSDSTIFETHIY